MNTLARNTIVQIVDKQQVKFAHPRQTHYLNKYLSELYRIHRLTKAGWYLLKTNDCFCPTITVPKKALKVVVTKLSNHGLSDEEIACFRRFRLILDGYFSSNTKIQDLDLDIETLKLALKKLGCEAKDDTSLKTIKHSLEPCLYFYVCE